MSHNPTTFRGESPEHHGPDLDDAASLHRRDDAGLLSEFKAIRQGTLGELVRFVAALPEDQRSGYVIAKGGDHRLELPEIMALARTAGQ